MALLTKSFRIDASLLEGAAGWQRENILEALAVCDGYEVEVGYVRNIPNLSTAEVKDRDDSLVPWACGIIALVQRGEFSVADMREHVILMRMRDGRGAVVFDTFDS
jgi:hypothetical protein